MLLEEEGRKPKHFMWIIPLVLVFSVVLFVLLISVFSFSSQASTYSVYKYKHNYQKYTANSPILRIVMVSDLDGKNKKGDLWYSDIVTGLLYKQGEKYSYIQEETFQVTSPINDGKRGLELSEAVNFNDEILTFDDRTGLVGAIDVDGRILVPKTIIRDGDMKEEKPMKIEWATVKGKEVYIGGIGKNYTTPRGEFRHRGPLFVKRMNENGRVIYEDWGKRYQDINLRLGINTEDGYSIFEAVTYSEDYDIWTFAPRKCSNERYDDELDETRGCGKIVMTSDFKNYRVVADKQFVKERGFPSIKNLPFDESKLLYLKSYEVNGVTMTYMGMMDFDGNVLMKDTKISDLKLEGVEFINL
uniref:Apyrase, putative n=1 Tax=Entamoeba invadens TaxID=33085 RepID=S0B6Y1_ENTIV|nr:apyrase precursor, putative [Entamoeba invadens]